MNNLRSSMNSSSRLE